MLNGRNALCNDDFRHIGQSRAERFLDFRVGGGVAGRCRVVENQDFRFSEQGSGDAKSLFLTARHVGSALFDACFILVRHFHHEFVGLRHPTCLTTLVKRGRFASPTQVVENRTREQRVLLQHHCHCRPQRLQIVVAHVAAAHRHAALNRIVKSADKADERRFSRTRTADDADGFARRDGE